jgi:uncharacterized membrane protein
MDLIVARVIHVLSVVLWIGGVAFVTTVLMPAVRRAHPEGERLAAFVRIEERFASQARITVALAGLSGLYLVVRFDAWARFVLPQFWWMHAMVGLWLAFAAMLFVVEPLILHRRLPRAIDRGEAGAIFTRMERFHQVMLVLSLITVAGAVAGSEGY